MAGDRVTGGAATFSAPIAPLVFGSVSVGYMSDANGSTPFISVGVGIGGSVGFPVTAGEFIGASGTTINNFSGLGFSQSVMSGEGAGIIYGSSGQVIGVEASQGYSLGVDMARRYPCPGLAT